MPTSRSPRRAAFYDAFRHYLADGARGAAAHAADFHEKVRSSDMRYAGEPLDVAYFPIAFGPEELSFLSGVVERTLAMLEHATVAFLRNPDLRKEFGWPEERWKIVEHDPGYPLAIPCARFDSYWDGARGVKFLEVNTDGTSGMTNVERVTQLFLESEGVREVGAPFGLSNFDLRSRVLETLLACYASWRAGASTVRPERSRRAPPPEPRIAIVDWRTVKTSAEFRALVRYFEERGLRATIADPRELSFDGETLREARGAGEPIDLVYRRVVSTEYFAASPQDVRALTDAYLAGAVCVVGSFRSDVAFDKRFLALLTRPEVAERLVPPGDLELAREVFPWTEILRPGPVLEMAKRERERFVVKPAALYEGRGVRIGIETDDLLWRTALDEAAPGGDHVLQERIAPPEITEEVPREWNWVENRGVARSDGRFEPKALYLSLGEYAFGGELIGFNARAASTLVLSADDDERLLPVVKLGGS